MDGLTAFVLAGGLGTRLRPVVADRPKVLGEVGGRPWLSYIFDQLVDAGVRRAVVGTGYLGEQVEAEFGAAYGPLALAYSREPEPLGTAGAVRFAAPLLGDGTVLVMNGDSYCDADLGRFLHWHRERGAGASLLLAAVADASRYGTVETDPDGRVTAFWEKREGVADAWINAGVYLVERAVRDSIPAEGAVSIERGVFPGLVGSGLYGYRAGGRFIDMGLPESFAAAQHFFPVENTGAVLLDRDGTLIVERHYLADPAGVELLPGAAEGLRRMRELGLRLVVVTNQSGIARGYLDEATLAAIHARMESLLAAEGVVLDGIFHCPHLPDAGCGCRKPLTGMAEQGARALGFSLSRSFMVGDKACDIGLGRRLGVPTVLVTTGYGARELEAGVAADAVAPDLAAAAKAIEEMLPPRARGYGSAVHPPL